MKKIFILTGEASGDKLASEVILNLKKINPEIFFTSLPKPSLQFPSKHPVTGTFSSAVKTQPKRKKNNEMKR